MMSRDAFLELRNKIRMGLSGFPTTSGGEVLCIDTDPDTEDLLVTWQHEGGQRTHRIVIKDETPLPDSPHGRMVEFLAESDRIIAEQGDVPRETSSFCVDAVYRVNGGALRTAQRTVEAEDWFHAVDQVRNDLTAAFPRDKIEFGNFSGGAVPDGGAVVDG